MLAYRTFWQETRADNHDDVLDVFRAWASTQQEVAKSAHPSECLTHLRTGTHPGAGRSGAEVFSQAALTLESPSERAETTLRVVSNSAGNWLWVDVQTTDDADHSEAADAAPELVARLIERAHAAQRQPRVDRTLLSTTPTIFNCHSRLVSDIDTHVRNPEHRLPAVVVAHDFHREEGGPKRTMSRANCVARRVAGVARVIVVADALVTNFQTEMGPDFDVGAGEIRIYMPGVDDATHDRHLSAERARRSDADTAHWCLSTLRRWLIARRLPVRAPRIIEPSPRSPREGAEEPADSSLNEQSVDEQIEQLEEDHETTFRALQQVRAQLKTAQEQVNELTAQAADYEEQVSELEQERDHALRDAAQQEQQANDSLKEESERAEKLRDQLVGYLANPEQTPTDLGQRRSMQVAREFRVGATVTGIADALNEFDEFWQHSGQEPPVVVHESVRKTVARLDRSMSREADGRKVLDALGALAFYALEVNDKTTGRGNDFRDWCLQTDHPRRWVGSDRTLAMKESEEVMRRPELMKRRELPIDPTVSLTGSHKSDREGYAYMWAHMKLTHGGAALRLHFYDDTRGKTKKVHVGYIGPHLPTKRFN